MISSGVAVTLAAVLRILAVRRRPHLLDEDAIAQPLSRRDILLRLGQSDRKAAGFDAHAAMFLRLRSVGMPSPGPPADPRWTLLAL